MNETFKLYEAKYFDLLEKIENGTVADGEAERIKLENYYIMMYESFKF